MSAEKVAMLVSLDVAKLAADYKDRGRELADQESDVRGRRLARRHLDAQVSKPRQISKGVINGGLLGAAAGLTAADGLPGGASKRRMATALLGTAAGAALGATHGNRKVDKTRSYRADSKSLDKPGVYNSLIRRRESRQKAIGDEFSREYKNS